MDASPPPARAPVASGPRNTAGQASLEYVALVALVAVLLVVAGAVGGVQSVPARVAGVVRTGICIAGGDVCRPVDAAAEGLAPCVVDEHARGSGLTVTIMSLRLGEKGEWTVARRSDGTVLITHLADRGAGAGIGVGAGALGLDVGAYGSLDLRVATGKAWELPDEAAAKDFLAAVEAGRERSLPPTWRFGDIGEEAGAQIGLTALGAVVPGARVSWRGAAGARTGRGEVTVYLHAGAGIAMPFNLLPPVGATERGSSTAPGGGRTAPLLVALTRDAHGWRELTVRRVERAGGQDDHRVVEVTGRLDVRDAANRAALGPLLSHRLPWPPSVADDLRAVIDLIQTHGTVERAEYAVDDDSQLISVAGRAGVELGVDASRLKVRRRLVAASAWTHGSPERQRVDCLPEEPPNAALG